MHRGRREARAVRPGLHRRGRPRWPPGPRGVAAGSTGEAAWLAVPGRAEAFELPHSAPLAELRDAVLAGGTLTVCTQCAARRDLSRGDLLPGVRIAGSAQLRRRDPARRTRKPSSTEPWPRTGATRRAARYGAKCSAQGERGLDQAGPSALDVARAPCRRGAAPTASSRPGAAKNRKSPVADVTTSAVNSPVRVEQPDVGAGHRRVVLARRRRRSRSPSSRSTPAGSVGVCAGAPHMSDVLLDRHADERAVLGPRAVVVLDVLVAEQLVQREPGVAGALADAAVGDGVLAVVQAGSSP